MDKNLRRKKRENKIIIEGRGKKERGRKERKNGKKRSEKD